ERWWLAEDAAADAVRRVDRRTAEHQLVDRPPRQLGEHAPAVGDAGERGELVVLDLGRTQADDPQRGRGDEEDQRADQRDQLSSAVPGAMLRVLPWQPRLVHRR